MRMSRTVSSGLLLVLTVAALSASAQTISYDAAVQPGNQAWTGNLGLDFDVNAMIVVSSLGAFNSNAPGGFAGTIQVAIFNRDTAAQIGGSVSLTGTAGTLINGDRFQTLLTPIALPAGHYSIVAVGFSAADLNGNTNFSGITPSTENTGGGLISFVGGGRYDSNTTLDFPAIVGTGPSNSLLAGTFQFAALPKDAVQVSYSANLKAGDSYIDLTSVGYNTSGPVADTDICANVYVFDDAQELIACCTCPLTLNHLKTLSALNDLVSNTLTPGVPADITTMLVASSGTCNASNPGPLVGGLRAWSTTLHAAPSGQYVVTEVPFSDVPWSATEHAKLTTTCGFVQANGSGYGICNSCVQGAAGAKKQ
jgi:hypothetical protein